MWVGGFSFGCRGQRRKKAKKTDDYKETGITKWFSRTMLSQVLGPFLGNPTIRNLVLRGLYWGPTADGNYHASLLQAPVAGYMPRASWLERSPFHETARKTLSPAQLNAQKPLQNHECCVWISGFPKISGPYMLPKNSSPKYRHPQNGPPCFGNPIRAELSFAHTT